MTRIWHVWDEIPEDEEYTEEDAYLDHEDFMWHLEREE